MTNIAGSKLERLVDKTILDALASRGFVKDETGGSFCDRGNVFLYVAGLTRRLGGKNQITPFGQVGFAATNKIYFSFMEPGKPIRKATGEFQVDYRHFAGERDAYIGCETEEEVPAELERVRSLVIDRLLPCVEKHTDPKEVLRVYVAHDERQKNSLGLLGAHSYSTALSGLDSRAALRP